MKSTPLLIKVLMHYYVSSQQYPIESIAEEMIHDDLVERRVLHYYVSSNSFVPDRGLILEYCEQILSLPLPKCMQ